MKLTAIMTPAIAAATLLVTAASLSATADAGTLTRLECRANGAVDISMSARYEVRTGGRKKFSTEFEAAPGLGYVAGAKLGVQVKGVKVGTMTLETLVGGDVVGDLNFDTRPQPPDSIAFPANWPTPIGRGTVVNVLRGTTLVLGCSIR